jgi:hypothetical protein
MTEDNYRAAQRTIAAMRALIEAYEANWFAAWSAKNPPTVEAGTRKPYTRYRRLNA